MAMENHKKHSLGHRAFILFFSQRVKYVIYMLAITLVAWYVVMHWLSGGNVVWGGLVLEGLIILSAIVLVLTLLRTYMEYSFYTYMFTEEAFVMTYGAITMTEVAALYHQIQNVNVLRTLSDRLFGVSRVVILMIGADKHSEHNRIVLPGIGKTKAKLVQKELLTRARHHFHPQNYSVAEAA